MKPIDAITEAIIGDAISVHRQLGPGLLESTYEACLAALLSRRGIQVERQVAITRVPDTHLRELQLVGVLGD